MPRIASRPVLFVIHDAPRLMRVVALRYLRKDLYRCGGLRFGDEEAIRRQASQRREADPQQKHHPPFVTLCHYQTSHGWAAERAAFSDWTQGSNRVI